MAEKTKSVTITRMFSDNEGESHFGDYQIALSPKVFAPPAPAAFVSFPYESGQGYFLLLPEGWCGDMHPAPRRQLMIIVRGEIEARVSDGEVRRFTAGDAVLAEDVTGRGHASKSLGGDVLVWVVPVA